MTNIQVFHATASARREISRRAYTAFGAGAAGLVFGAIIIGVTFASDTASNLMIAGAGGLACAGLGGLVLGISNLMRIQQSIQVEVSPHRLVWREGRRTAVLEYEEVERVDLLRGEHHLKDGRVLNFPVVRFIESDGEMMEFEVTFDDRGMLHRSRFDALGITAAVLPYIHQQAIIAPSVQDFVRTGEVDIDGLPER